MRVLCPNSVSTGTTDRHVDCSPQSPQPSQTRSLIQTRSGGSASFPRWRSRRSSAAHRSSWMTTVTPPTFSSSAITSGRSSRWRTSATGSRVTLRYCSGSGVVTTTLRTPSMASSRVSSGTAMRPERLLAAGHGHGAVVEEAVGDVDTGRHRRPHGQRAGVEEGAVAQVLDVVAAAGEGRQADPLGTLAPHLGETHVVAPAVLVEGGHDVTADAEPDQLVVGRPGRDVVWASRAEIRGP